MMSKAIEKDFRVALSSEQWKEMRNLKIDHNICKNHIAYIGISYVLGNKAMLDEMRKEAAKKKEEKKEENKVYQAEYARKRRANKVLKTTRFAISTTNMGRENKALETARVAILTTNMGRATGEKGEK